MVGKAGHATIPATAPVDSDFFCMASSSKSKAITVRAQPPLPPRLALEERMKQERLHDTELLLQDLFLREEATIKQIMGHLYDIGAVNLINNRVSFPPLKRLLKSLVGVPKPLAKILLFRWFINNCPELLTNWLHSKVKFKK